MLAGVVISLLQGKGLVGHLGQGGYTSVLSIIQLLAASGVAWYLFYHRKRQVRAGISGGRPAMWAVLAAGIVFLVLDQALAIHSWLATLIVRSFDLDTTNLFAGIGDLAVGLYGLIGMALILHLRDELRLFAEGFGPLRVGVAFFFCAVVLDVIGGKGYILRLMITDLNVVETYRVWLSAAKDVLTIAAEGALVVFCLFSVDIARKMRGEARN